MVEYLDSIFQKNMENVSLSIKEEIANETQNGSSNLHLEEDSSKVMRCEVDQFSDSSFIVSFAISQFSFRLVRCLARCL